MCSRGPARTPPAWTSPIGVRPRLTWASSTKASPTRLPRAPRACTSPRRCPDIGGACYEILSRYQRFFNRRNHASKDALFDRILASHRHTYDPNIHEARADYDHTVDTWQWLLRLDGSASLPLQVAALFHDVNPSARGLTLTAPRRDASASESVGNGANHGAATNAMERSRHALRETGLDERTRARIRDLVAAHGQPSADPEARLLAEADALSFLSLKSAGYVDCFGTDEAQKKIAHTIVRLRPETRRLLSRVRFRHDVRALLAAELHRTEKEAGAALQRIN